MLNFDSEQNLWTGRMQVGFHMQILSHFQDDRDRGELICKVSTKKKKHNKSQ